MGIPRTCRGSPRGVEDATLLDIGAESDRDLVEIATEDRSVPDRRAIVDGDLPRENNIRGDIRVDGDLREPLPQRNDPPLPPVIPLHPIGGRTRRRRLRRQIPHRNETRLGSRQGSQTPPRQPKQRRRHLPPFQLFTSPTTAAAETQTETNHKEQLPAAQSGVETRANEPSRYLARATPA